MNVEKRHFYIISQSLFSTTSCGKKGIKMDRNTAKRIVESKEPTFLEKAKTKVNGRNTYICPKCGNGSKESGTGIALDPHSKDKNRYKCFKCGLSEDVIGLWKIFNYKTDNKKAFNTLYEYYGLEIDSPTSKEDYREKTIAQTSSNEDNHENIHTSVYTPEDLKTKENQPWEYIKECHSRIGLTDYPQKRGLSAEVIEKYKLGYDPNFTQSTGGEVWEALIIPTGLDSFVARNIAPEADHKKRYRKYGANQLYNKKALQETAKPIFIVEGELDALSIITAGGQALALGSTSNYKKLVEELKHQKPKQPLILALDNDEDGKARTETLATELKKIQVPFYRLNVYGAKKDANEALLAGGEYFKEEIERAGRTIEELQQVKGSNAEFLQDFLNGIGASVNTPCTATGFTVLDEVLDGGFYEGLYVVGAISSLGKTTFVTQITDQIAEAGGNVLIFSLEMARQELMAKSISRLTYLDVVTNKGKIQHAKTARGITDGSRYKNYSPEEKALITKSIKVYGNYSKNIYTKEGIGDIGVEEVRKTIRDHIDQYKRKPVVVIDYLQILAPNNVRASDKQNTDKAILELKRISRDYKIPVIAISSFNRESYDKEVTMQAFKESGAIEYSCDVLIGLQLKGVRGDKRKGDNFNPNEAKKKYPREVELVVLKNRNGAIGDILNYDYYPMFNYFRELGKEKET